MDITTVSQHTVEKLSSSLGDKLFTPVTGSHACNYWAKRERWSGDAAVAGLQLLQY